MKQLLAVLLFLSAGGLPAQVPDPGILGDLPIQNQGRKKPYYTFCTDVWKSVSGRASWQDGTGETRGAVEVVTDIWFHPRDWVDRPVVRVDYLPLKEALGLPDDRHLFSLNELSANGEFGRLYGELARFQQGRPQAELDAMQKAVQQAGFRVEVFQSLLDGTAYTLVPNPHGASADWMTLGSAATIYQPARLQPLASAYRDLADAYDGGDAESWANAAGVFADRLQELAPGVYPPAWKMKLEHSYNVFHPFRWAWVAYALAMLVLMLTSLSWRREGYAAGWCLALAGFLLQVTGITMRILIAGRPPVTNMYETVVWLAFAAVLFALVFEAIYRARYFLLGAAPVAVISLILADTQPAILDPAINPLVPVLRSNFWLVIHVLTITSSYAAFALALGVAHIILGKVLLGREVKAELYRYLYRSLQVGVFLVGAGTILGGVWANYSWGRFWGWDPKETWALIVFLFYLAVLHGRIAGWWGGFGLAVGSMLGFQTVLMAWYGVNFVLGKGLHSYGFGTGGFPAVLVIVLVELAFTGLAIAAYRRRWDVHPTAS